MLLSREWLGKNGESSELYFSHKQLVLVAALVSTGANFLNCPVLEKVDHKVNEMTQVKIVLKPHGPKRFYSEAFKRQVVREYEQGGT